MPKPRLSEYDAIVVGSGPNGLSAAIRLAQAGRRTLVVEAAERIGGGLRCAELTRPGFLHDHCAAVHPMGALSPYWRTLALHEHGLEWIEAPVSAAHPLEDGRVALLWHGIEATAESLEQDGAAYRKLMQPFVAHADELFDDLILMRKWPRHRWATARFAWLARRSARGLARSRFDGELGRALIAGCGAHSLLPLEFTLSGAVALMFCLSSHVRAWPVVRGGSEALARALGSVFRGLGGEIVCGQRVRSLDALPSASVILFDTAPREVVAIAGDQLPAGYRRRLERYRYGPGVFKVDWALREPIPWRAAACREASTVHVGGTLDDICESESTMWSRGVSEKPFVMVCQQSHFDVSRAPAGQHTGYAYIHVPHGYREDCETTILEQIERFAPGFRDCILASHVTRPADFERGNPAFVGGSVTGGVADWRQFITRPVARIDPYSTPNPRLFLCSAATPPGGGVHGLGGWLAAESVLRRQRGTSTRALASGG
ncbi:MAG: NAD(P)/FAD-dependent oxidoreductase [Myxococcales bacterium FL481]|nr:MAG: NAD(P)/FAD-dependent oxidoreductase [Myxococcales bacterium FL481]